MTKNTSQIIIRGELVEGIQFNNALTRVARLLNATPQQVTPLFSGRRVTVNATLDCATARKLQQTLKTAGLLTHIAKVANARAGENDNTLSVHIPNINDFAPN